MQEHPCIDEKANKRFKDLVARLQDDTDYDGRYEHGLSGALTTLCNVYYYRAPEAFAGSCLAQRRNM